MNRRNFLRKVATLAVTAPFFNGGRFQLFSDSTMQYSARAVELVHRSLIVDMLNQFKLGAFPDVLPEPFPPTATWWSHPATFTPADLQRYKDSGITAFHIGWGAGRDDPFSGAVKVLQAWHGLMAYFPGDFWPILRAADFFHAKRNGRIGIILGFQDSDHFRSLADVDYFYRLGQRVSQLTYNLRNAIGSGYEDQDDGLTRFGAEVVSRMNQVGMAVDLAHCGPRTTLDACAASRKPVLFTHANCRALTPNSRCKSDDAIRKMAATGGVMGITAIRMFARAAEPVTIENVLDHFDYVARLVGIEHVGVGSDIDLDGYDKLPSTLRARMLTGYKDSPAFHGLGDIEGLNHPRRMFDLTEGLIRRKYSDAAIELILGGNFYRALAQIWQHAAAPSS